MVNVPLSYGRSEDARRARELAEAVALAGFRLRPPTRPLDLSANELDEAVAEILDALEAHVGELERNDSRHLVEGRGAANAVLAPELLAGFVTAGSAGYTELLTEVAYVADSWLLGRPRWLQPEHLLVPPTATDVSEWLGEPSVADRFGLHAARTLS